MPSEPDKHTPTENAANGELRVLPSGETMSDEIYQITPLGAAWVEALPDKKKASMIQRRFKSHNECPESKRFDRDSVKAWYESRGRSIVVPECDAKAKQ